jgi:hypothetical protein
MPTRLTLLGHHLSKKMAHAKAVPKGKRSDEHCSQLFMHQIGTPNELIYHNKCRHASVS